MTEILKFEATERNVAGTGSSRALRRNGLIPVIIYGDNKKEVKASLPLNSFKTEYFKGGMKTKLVELNLGGEKITALPKDIQVDPVTDSPIHVDLLRIGKDSTVEVAIAVRTLNEEKAPGIKKGGAINIAHRELVLKCHPAKIPHHIEIDVSSMDIGQSIHLKDITLPEGCEASESPDVTLLSMVGRVEESEETVVAEGAEAGAAAESSAS